VSEEAGGFGGARVGRKRECLTSAWYSATVKGENTSGHSQSKIWGKDRGALKGGTAF